MKLRESALWTLAGYVLVGAIVTGAMILDARRRPVFFEPGMCEAPILIETDHRTRWPMHEEMTK